MNAWIADKTNFNTSEKQEISQIKDEYQKIIAGLRRHIVGMEEIIEQLLICIFSGGHALMIGVPGLAKTLLLRSVSELLDLNFSRIQFTPDLMPSDITGTEILVQDGPDASRHFKFLQGPIFANIILGDEINRTPPKTQSALLEAMEEGSVTSMGKIFQLDPPFFVLATQNPIEQEGTYPLPAAQLDRFMFNMIIDYPSVSEEYSIIRQTLVVENHAPQPIINKERILRIMDLVRKVEMPDSVMRYAVSLCRNSRPQEETTPEFIKQYFAWGGSPRAGQALINGGKARALLKGRTKAIADDIRSVFLPAMRHRVLPNYRAEADGISVDKLLSELLKNVPAPDEKREKKTLFSFASSFLSL